MRICSTRYQKANISLVAVIHQLHIIYYEHVGYGSGTYLSAIDSGKGQQVADAFRAAKQPPTPPTNDKS